MAHHVSYDLCHRTLCPGNSGMHSSANRCRVGQLQQLNLRQQHCLLLRTGTCSACMLCNTALLWLQDEACSAPIQGAISSKPAHKPLPSHPPPLPAEQDPRCYRPAAAAAPAPGFMQLPSCAQLSQQMGGPSAPGSQAAPALAASPELPASCQGAQPCRGAAAAEGSTQAWQAPQQQQQQQQQGDPLVSEFGPQTQAASKASRQQVCDSSAAGPVPLLAVRALHACVKGTSAGPPAAHVMHDTMAATLLIFMSASMTALDVATSCAVLCLQALSPALPCVSQPCAHASERCLLSACKLHLPCT